MKKVLNIIIIFLFCLLMSGCDLFGSNPKITFNYNCEGLNDYNCQVIDNKLNCMFIMPECGEKTFVGWYDAKTSGKEVNLDADFTKSTTIYAQWKEEGEITPEPEPTPEPIIDIDEEPIIEQEPVEVVYKVTFNVNGGSGGQSATIEVKYGDKMPSVSKTIPTRSGYTFMGWYDNSDYSRGEAYYNELCEASRYYDRESNVILYAGWKTNAVTQEPTQDSTTKPTVEKYKVSFNANGGNGGPKESIEVTYSEAMPSLNSGIPTRKGYTFVGWYDNSDYTKGMEYYSSKQETLTKYNKKSNITLYAGWKINKYLIKFNANGGSGGQTNNISVEYEAMMPSINTTKPVREGYTFTGWYDNTDYTKGKAYYNEKNEATKYFDKTSDLTLYAGWSKIIVVQKYKVTFNINGGSGTTPSAVDAAVGNNMPSITTIIPTRTNYTFMGWYNNSDYTKGTQYYTNKNESARKYDIKSNTTLYAGWKSNVVTCTITYNANGGTGAPAKQTYTYATSGTINLSSTKPTRDGYSFLGWATSKNAKTATYSAGQSWNKSNKGDYTLYAIWGTTLKIYYLSLGRYDGYLIQGNGTTIFIDGGDMDPTHKNIYKDPGHQATLFLKELGVTKIDALVGSHLHKNHIDAHMEMIDNFKIGGVYYPDDPRTHKERKTSTNAVDVTKLNQMISANNIPLTIMTPQLNFRIGNLTFDILGPLELGANANNNSAHMILKYGDHKFYFSGDSGTGVFKQIYNKFDHSLFENITIFKHPHHGQNEVPKTFREVMKPKYVIVPNTSTKLASSEFSAYKSTVWALGDRLIKKSTVITGAGDNLMGYVLAESDGKTLTVTDKR